MFIVYTCIHRLLNCTKCDFKPMCTVQAIKMSKTYTNKLVSSDKISQLNLKQTAK